VDTPSQPETDFLADRIDAIPDLSGAGLGFVGGDECVLLRRSQHSSGLDTYVVLEAEDTEGPPPAVEDNNGPSIAMELLGAGFNCTGAVFGWIALGGEGLATAASGGLSAALIPVTYVAAGSTTIQCGISLVRSYDTIFNKGAWTRWLDSKDSYTYLSWALDGASLLGAAASASAALRAAQAIRRATGRSWLAVLKGMSRAERKRLAEELIRLNRPGISGGEMKALISMGTFTKRLGATEFTERLARQLKDAVSAMLSFGSSGLSGLVRKGVTNIYIHVMQE
jgi:hypothetical protein